IELEATNTTSKAKPCPVGCGAVSVDFLATVAAYPKPDDKIRSTSFKVQGGGNAGNALTCASRLGLNPRLISKVADDTQGRDILRELEVDGVDTSFMAVVFSPLQSSSVSQEGTSPFTYIIVDSQTKSRTCIHTPGSPPMEPADLPQSSLLSALNGARIVYFDGRLHETALVVAHEAVKKNIPILMDAERLREGLDDLLKLADYVVCAAQFPQARALFSLKAWTEASSVPKALVCMLLRLPNIKFVIVTLGKDGSIMLERCVNESSSTEEVDVDKLLESLKMRKNGSTHIPTCISSSVTKLHAEGIGTVCGRLYIGTAESIPPSELIDTTGAGDAFIGAVLYGSFQVQSSRSKKWSPLPRRPMSGILHAIANVSKGGSSTFSYVQVDNQTNTPRKTRTSIYTPGDPPMMPDDLSQSTLLSAFGGARLVYSDGMFPETALFVAQEAARNNIPILVEAESPREGLDELLKLADFVICSARFPQAWTQAPSLSSALVSMLLRLPNINFVIVTLGENGCLMLERSANANTIYKFNILDADIEERDVESFLELLYKGKMIAWLSLPAVMKFRANGIGTICGRFYIGTAEKIPDSELIDTTGAGDAFIGAIMYAICANMVPEKMLPFAAQVAAVKCRALGARTGLPHRTDPRLASFVEFPVREAQRSSIS
ncbi:rbsK, partial [Mucuna pruriens]